LVSALWPDSVAGLVTVDGYNVQDLSGALTPALPERESVYWYQYYLHGERGRRGLEQYRAEYAKLLWQQWSPRWSFTDETLMATVEAFDNPDFVDVVVHSYRHRYGLVDGDPAYEPTERRIATRPVITVPTVVLDTRYDGLGTRPGTGSHQDHFTKLVAHRVVDAGHGLPQEDPRAFADAVLLLSDR
jgi:pimeloyl-ACP methyl ester carboxylesterase